MKDVFNMEKCKSGRFILIVEGGRIDYVTEWFNLVTVKLFSFYRPVTSKVNLKRVILTLTRIQNIQILSECKGKV